MKAELLCCLDHFHGTCNLPAFLLLCEVGSCYFPQLWNQIEILRCCSKLCCDKCLCFIKEWWFLVDCLVHSSVIRPKKDIQTTIIEIFVIWCGFLSPLNPLEICSQASSLVFEDILKVKNNNKKRTTHKSCILLCKSTQSVVWWVKDKLVNVSVSCGSWVFTLFLGFEQTLTSQHFVTCYGDWYE